MSTRIELYEGEAVVYTVTIKRGGSAVDLTAHEAIGVSAITASIWDDDGTIIAADFNITAYSDAANGVVTVTFTTTHTTLPSGDTERHGKWRLKLNDGSEIEKLTPGEWILHEDKGQT